MFHSNDIDKKTSRRTRYLIHLVFKDVEETASDLVK